MLDLQMSLKTTSTTDNLPAQHDIHPSQDVPTIGLCRIVIELSMARWGFSPLPGQKSPITNVRHLNSRQ